MKNWVVSERVSSREYFFTYNIGIPDLVVFFRRYDANRFADPKLAEILQRVVQQGFRKKPIFLFRPGRILGIVSCSFAYFDEIGLVYHYDDKTWHLKVDREDLVCNIGSGVFESVNKTREKWYFDMLFDSNDPLV